MIYGEGSNEEQMVTGLEAIKAKMRERSSRKWVLNLEHGSVDAQRSMDGGVMLLVTGTITCKKHSQPRQVLPFFKFRYFSHQSYFSSTNMLRTLFF